MYLKYSDLPIFSNLITLGQNKFDNNTVAGDADLNTANHLFAAVEASLSLDANLSPNRYLGVAQRSNDFAMTGPLQGKFSVTFCPLIEKQPVGNALPKLNVQRNNQLNFFNLSGNVWSTWNFSSYKLKKTFLDNYSIKINPYQPVMVTANFTTYDVTGNVNQRISGYAEYSNTNLSIPKLTNANTAYYEALHGLTTNVTKTPEPEGFVSQYAQALLNNSIKPDSNSPALLPAVTEAKFNPVTYVDPEYPVDVLLPQSKLSIEINVDCKRTPIYQLGDVVPSDVVLTAVERTVTVQGEDIGRAIDINGGNPGVLNINFLPFSARKDPSPIPSSTNNVLTFKISGRVTSQQLSVSQGSMLNGKVVIKEIIL